MTVLVTGGAGYIGSHMVLELLAAGEQVVVLDNLSTGFRWAVPPNAKLVVGDVGDQALVGDIIKEHDIESIIHFAGSIIVPESVEKPLDYYHNNTGNSRALIEAAINNQVKKFIFSSTAAVYGMPEENPVAETATLKPISPYGSSKLMTEVMLADASHAYEFQFVALRYFNVAGADPDGRTGQSTPQATHLIKVACQTALGKRTHIDVFGTDYPTPDGTCIRDYIHVKDLARAHMSALAHLRRGSQSEIFNCGYSHGFSVREVIAAVKAASGNDFAVKDAARRVGDPAEIVAATGKIRKTLDWVPEYDDLNLIVQHAYNWEARLAELKKSA